MRRPPRRRRASRRAPTRPNRRAIRPAGRSPAGRGGRAVRSSAGRGSRRAAGAWSAAITTRASRAVVAFVARCTCRTSSAGCQPPFHIAPVSRSACRSASRRTTAGSIVQRRSVASATTWSSTCCRADAARSSSASASSRVENGSFGCASSSDQWLSSRGARRGPGPCARRLRLRRAPRRFCFPMRGTITARCDIDRPASPSGAIYAILRVVAFERVAVLEFACGSLRRTRPWTRPRTRGGARRRRRPR